MVWVPAGENAFPLFQNLRTVLDPSSLLNRGYQGRSLCGKSARMWSWPNILSGAKVRNEWNFATTPPHAFMTCTEKYWSLSNNTWLRREYEIMTHCAISPQSLIPTPTPPALHMKFHARCGQLKGPTYRKAFPSTIFSEEFQNSTATS